ncbi:MAG: DUF4145 domain-containing protein [Lachnospiraceae bacterium]|nr:DUF4145 domain-containing protein [Lachnospiraceae bacterium]
MAGFQCPYCSMIMPISVDTMRERKTSFDSDDGFVWLHGVRQIESASCIKISFYKCPNCDQYTIKATGTGDKIDDVDFPIRPISSAKQFPQYIPEAIRKDYEEACAIVTLSPKASATLSRRCLQGMIRDFWGIKEKNLYDEISALKNQIPADLWSSIDALRQLGNIGAHMEKDTNVIVDIDPDEADSLIKLIELLIKEWYINREERKKLFSSIITTNQTKQTERKKN